MNQIINVGTGATTFEVQTPPTWPNYSGISQDDNHIVTLEAVTIPSLENVTRVSVEVQKSFSIALGLSLEFE